MSEQAKYEAVCLDRISELPDDVRRHILSFLPNKYAVRTSILSHKWRDLFASSISIIDCFDQYVPSKKGFIDCFEYVPSKNEQVINRSLLNFVDSLFSNPKLVSLEGFTVNIDWVYSKNDYLRLNGWLCAALRLGVKRLHMYLTDGWNIYNYKTLSIPSLMFTAHSLATLKLVYDYGDIEVPTNVSLPNLKTLHFENFLFRDSSVNRLISGCSVLEDLSFIQCDFEITKLHIHNLSLKRLIMDLPEMYHMYHMYPRDFYVTVINAPNLVYFKYADTIDGGYTSSNFKYLDEADILLHKSNGYFDEYNNEEERYNLNGHHAVANLLQAISNVKSLKLTIKVVEMRIPMHPEPLLQFYKLVEFEFHTVEGRDWQGTWVIEFLHCMPNLKTLFLDLVDADTRITPLPKEVPPCLLFHLKEIKISCFKEEEHMFEMISYFLHHATFLEKLILGQMKLLKVEEKFKITQKVLELPRNSKKCQIVTVL